VAECLPAAIEGTYSSLPLILVTADRPKRYRGSGAPQSIDQVGIFSYYIEACFDLDAVNTHVSLNGLSWKKPVHVNVCFGEPLLDGPVSKISLPEQELRTRFPEAIPIQMVDEIQEFLEKHRPVILLSTIPEKAQDHVVNFLSRLKAPIYAEGISGLRGHPAIKDFEIRSGDKMIARLIDEGVCDSVFRIGGVPTVRFWRDLEDKRSELPVFSLGYNHYTGLSRGIPHYDDLDDLSRIDVTQAKPLAHAVRDFDQKMCLKISELFRKYPKAEPSLVHALSKHLGGQSVYLGNSLPIREWDLAATLDDPPDRTVGNRGANGIDGQVSTFLGWCRPETQNWCVIGDLTALYDLSALWVAPQLLAAKIRIVVLNNSGGMIFDRMFGKEIFLNRHDVRFESWAKMWNWGYTRFEGIPPKFEGLQDRHILEITVSEEETKAFWKEWDQLWS
jgi:2-succinyl-5-enolpyruvyl-6-hydroxy-3-cyclohexene-1-carboxylate synthase